MREKGTNEFFASRLNTLLAETKTKKVKLATAVGCPAVTICRYSNGERRPCLENAVQIADYFNVSLDYLCGRSDSRDLEQELAYEKEITRDLHKDNLQLLAENDRLKYRVHILEKQIEIMTLSFGRKPK